MLKMSIFQSHHLSECLTFIIIMIFQSSKVLYELLRTLCASFFEGHRLLHIDIFWSCWPQVPLEMSWHGELSGGGPQPQIFVRILAVSIEDLEVQELQARNSCGTWGVWACLCTSKVSDKLPTSQSWQMCAGVASSPDTLQELCSNESRILTEFYHILSCCLPVSSSADRNAKPRVVRWSVTILESEYEMAWQNSLCADRSKHLERIVVANQTSCLVPSSIHSISCSCQKSGCKTRHKAFQFRSSKIWMWQHQALRSTARTVRIVGSARQRGYPAEWTVTQIAGRVFTQLHVSLLHCAKCWMPNQWTRQAPSHVHKLCGDYWQ